MPVGRNKDRRSPSTQTAHRAVTVDFTLTGIHHSQVALAVYDLASQAQSSQIASCLLNYRRGLHDGDGPGCYLHHSSALTIDQLALQTDLFAVEAGHEVVGPMFSGRDQQIARIFVLLPDCSRTRDQQRWEGLRHDNSLKTAHLPIFERGISKRHLSNNQHQRRGHRKQAEHNNDPSHKTSQRGGRLRQIAYVEVDHRGCASVDSILAGSTRVPGGLGRGCTKTDPSTTLTRKVGTFSLNGGGAAPDSGWYW